MWCTRLFPRVEIVCSLWMNTAFRAVHVALICEISQSPRGAYRVRHVCRIVYSRGENEPAGSLLSPLKIRMASETALACCFFKLDGSVCPRRVAA